MARVLEEATEEEEMRRVQILQQMSLRPFAVPPDHVATAVNEWRLVIAGTQPPSCRSRPVVVDGPTRTGKTQWAESIFGAERTLTVNCQNAKEPVLRHFNRALYDAIIFEEADWRLVYENKMLFQARNNAVDMGRSATNVHHYVVRLHGVAMFVVGNAFYNGIAENLPAKEYVEQNVVYWNVEGPLWD